MQFLWIRITVSSVFRIIDLKVRLRQLHFLLKLCLVKIFNNTFGWSINKDEEWSLKKWCVKNDERKINKKKKMVKILAPLQVELVRKCFSSKWVNIWINVPFSHMFSKKCIRKKFLSLNRLLQKNSFFYIFQIILKDKGNWLSISQN